MKQCEDWDECQRFGGGGGGEFHGASLYGSKSLILSQASVKGTSINDTPVAIQLPAISCLSQMFISNNFGTFHQKSKQLTIIFE